MHRKSLALNRSLGRKEGIAGDYANLGNVYKTRGDLAQAKALWNKSLSLYQEMGHPNAEIVRQALDEPVQQRSSQ